MFYVLSLATFAGALSAENKTWNGGGSSWHDGSGWTPSGVPTASDDVLGQSTGSAETTNVGSDVTISSLALGSGDQTWSMRVLAGDGTNHMFTIQNSLTQNSANVLQFYTNANASDSLSMTIGTATTQGSISVNAGTLRLGGFADNMELKSFTYTGPVTPTTTVATGATLMMSVLSADGTDGSYSLGNVNNDGTINLTRRETGVAAEVTFSSLTGSASGVISGSQGSSDNVDVILTVNQDADTTYAGILVDREDGIVNTSNMSLIKSGTGSLTLSGANTHSGGTDIDAGTLVAANADALGTGAVTLDGGSLSLNGASTQSLNVSDNLTMNSGTLLFSYESGGGTFDQIVGGGGLSFTIVGGILDLGNYDWDYESTYALLLGFGSGSVSGLSIINYDTANYLASLGDDGVLEFSAIPEPGHFALAGGVLALLSVMWRRRSIA